MAKILVIDDDPAVRMTVKLLLDRDGHEVVVAPDGRVGLQMFAAGGIELLIVDLFMPGMDGLETIREVRARRTDLPIIVMSGTVVRHVNGEAPDFLNMAVKLGAVRAMQKPFKPRDIVQAVRDCLAGGTLSQRGSTG